MDWLTLHNPEAQANLGRENEVPWSLTAPVVALAMSEGFTILAMASPIGTSEVFVWNAASERGFTLKGDSDGVTHVAMAARADGNLVLASGSHDGVVQLWDPLMGRALGEPQTICSGPVTALAIASRSDGSMLLACGTHDGHVQLWDPDSGDHTGSIPVAPGRTVDQLALTGISDRRLLLASNSQSSNVELWDPDAREIQGTIATNEMAYSVDALSMATWPAGSVCVASSSDDRYPGEVRFFDPANPEGAGILTAAWGWAHAFSVAESRLVSLSLAVASEGSMMVAASSEFGIVSVSGEPWEVRILPDGELAILDTQTQELKGVTSGAWRWFLWQVPRPDDKYELLPAESHPCYTSVLFKDQVSSHATNEGKRSSTAFIS